MSCGTTKVALFTTLVDDGKLALPALELCLPPRRCAFAITRYAEGLTKPGLRPHSPRPAGPAPAPPRHGVPACSCALAAESRCSSPCNLE